MEDVLQHSQHQHQPTAVGVNLILTGHARLKATAGIAKSFSSPSTDYNITIAQGTYARLPDNKTITHDDKVNIRSMTPDRDQTIILPDTV